MVKGGYFSKRIFALSVPVVTEITHGNVNKHNTFVFEEHYATMGGEKVSSLIEDNDINLRDESVNVETRFFLKWA